MVNLVGVEDVLSSYPRNLLCMHYTCNSRQGGASSEDKASEQDRTPQKTKKNKKKKTPPPPTPPPRTPKTKRKTRRRQPRASSGEIKKKNKTLGHRICRGMSEVRRGTSSIHFHCPASRSSSHIGHGTFRIRF